MSMPTRHLVDQFNPSVEWTLDSQIFRKTVNLAVWPVSGDVLKQQDFRQTLSRSSYLHGVRSIKKRYAGFWRAWAEWCTMRGWCPFSAPVTSVLSFLAGLLKEKDLEYRTIAVYISVISQTHDPMDSVPLAFTTSARAHELAALGLDFSLVKEDAWEFSIPEQVKNSKPGHPRGSSTSLHFHKTVLSV
ncbi:Hypothetical predicted protein [Paramuricea clavata]|uniref:Uncharacterized protein n=1 Tax=Paramuricea clavata TaxID=317549 RepID=A0A6S7GUA1_PARCT|nr:Hypothetical predicted protein [Paramuricea clavata]